MWASPAPRSGCICHGRQNAPFTDAASPDAVRFLKELPSECLELNVQKYERNEIVEEASVEKKTYSFSDHLQHKPNVYKSARLKRPRRKAPAPLISAIRSSMKKFGIGTIVEVKPNQVSIAFPGVGIKKLDPSYVTKA